MFVGITIIHFVIEVIRGISDNTDSYFKLKNSIFHIKHTASVLRNLV